MPRRVDHDQRRRQIGEALLRIANTRGLQHASMREVALEAQVSLRLVQYYFHTKDELLLAALGYLGEQLSERVRESASMIVGRDALEEFRWRVLPLSSKPDRRGS